MRPRIPITDKRFVYTSAIKTDLRKTFERIRQERQQKQASVTPIKRKGG